MLQIFGSEVWETPPGQTGGVYPFKGLRDYEELAEGIAAVPLPQPIFSLRISTS